MSSTPLKPFSYVVLALVGDGGAGPHDLVAMMRRSPVYWDAAPSQWYAEPKRLAQLGYLSARREPGRTRERTHYLLTEPGREALRHWLAQPARFTRMQNEAAVRLLAGDLVDDAAAIVTSLRGLREDVVRLEASLAESRQRAALLPHRARYLELSHRLAARLLSVHREWVDEVTAELE